MAERKRKAPGQHYYMSEPLVMSPKHLKVQEVMRRAARDLRAMGFTVVDVEINVDGERHRGLSVLPKQCAAEVTKMSDMLKDCHDMLSDLTNPNVSKKGDF